jgi:hypothetical protein
MGMLIFQFWFCIYVSFALFLYHYNYFIKCFEIIQEWSYNPKFEIDLIMCPLFSVTNIHFSYYEMGAIVEHQCFVHM